ncbi:MAG: amidohydrolase family protein [Gemmatimonadaceae bacterium]|nr:amidohydrolase family protein [Gemmatimonadaceae bacterium]
MPFEITRHAVIAHLIALSFVSAAALSAQTPAARSTPPRAELILTNARIYTADDGQPIAEALAVSGGKLLFVGSTIEAMALKGAGTTVIDAGGRTVIPGMTDAHAHLYGLGVELRQVDLTGTKSYDEVIARVVAKAATVAKGTPVLGRGWDQNDWSDTRLPTNAALTAATPDHPVLLTRVDGHALLANAAAVSKARVTVDTKDPEGGRILRDARGTPTGVFVDNAQDLMESAARGGEALNPREVLRNAVREANRWGLTGVHEMGVPPAVVGTYEAAAQAGELTLRAYVLLSGDSATVNWAMSKGPRSALFDGRLWVRSIKLYGDGALGSRGAALLDPYADDAQNNGLLVMQPAWVESVAERALKTGWQVATHAIGDRANRLVLDAYASALKAVPTADHRFRIEHAQIIHHDDIGRFATLGVIPSMQASHQTSDMYWAGNRLGVERLRGAYAWRSLLATGVIIPNGSDFPVEYVNPLLSFHAAIVRQDADDFPAGGWYPEQRMTRDEALRSMTIWPARASFQEHVLGSLTAGKYADFVLLDQDIMRVAPELVLRTHVLQTWVGGTKVYEMPTR